MTLAELDKFYQLGNIEGLALINEEGHLVEDQLVLSSAASAVVAKSFFQIHRSLEEAGRSCRGFLAKFSEYQFVSMVVNSGILILQFNSDQKVNSIYEQAVMMASYQTVSPSGPQQESSPVLELVSEEDEGLLLTWLDFKSGLSKALSRVAPSNLIKKLMDDAIESAGVNTEDTPSLEQMKIIGIRAIELVPNKGRRKMVEKELQIVLQNIGL